MIRCWFGYRFQIINLIKRYSTHKIRVIFEAPFFLFLSLSISLSFGHCYAAAVDISFAYWYRTTKSMIGNFMRDRHEYFWFVFLMRTNRKCLCANGVIFGAFSFVFPAWYLGSCSHSLNYSSAKGYCSRSTKRRKIKTNGFSHRFSWKKTHTKK